MLWFRCDEIPISILTLIKIGCHHFELVSKCFEFSQFSSILMEMIFRGGNVKDVFNAAQLRHFGVGLAQARRLC